ncbi:Cx9C motif-containing protein 4, mitochondrial [Coniosporium tulheliwenetii]|uniref:Cx9C motif-containing protein 4, mitochondrial n=1 Tax=Coniosporium tulheliwenetii TaxID=3383036 RepID=A0ACC2ZAQ0_9PEZI|nr:Cx9C motif-containing protein 4, mitochondrial [Cladosporium sp. JES 115]
MGVEKDIQQDPPCHARACAIQDCIQKNNYNEAKCSKEIDALYECCNAFYKKNGDDASTVTCPKASLLRLKMKQRAQGIK